MTDVTQHDERNALQFEMQFELLTVKKNKQPDGLFMSLVGHSTRRRRANNIDRTQPAQSNSRLDRRHIQRLPMCPTLFAIFYHVPAAVAEVNADRCRLTWWPTDRGDGGPLVIERGGCQIN